MYYGCSNKQEVHDLIKIGIRCLQILLIVLWLASLRWKKLTRAFYYVSIIILFLETAIDGSCRQQRRNRAKFATQEGLEALELAFIVWSMAFDMLYDTIFLIVVQLAQIFLNRTPVISYKQDGEGMRQVTMTVVGLISLISVSMFMYHSSREHSRLKQTCDSLHAIQTNMPTGLLVLSTKSAYGPRVEESELQVDFANPEAENLL